MEEHNSVMTENYQYFLLTNLLQNYKFSGWSCMDSPPPFSEKSDGNLLKRVTDIFALFYHIHSNHTLWIELKMILCSLSVLGEVQSFLTVFNWRFLFELNIFVSRKYFCNWLKLHLKLNKSSQMFNWYLEKMKKKTQEQHNEHNRWKMKCKATHQTQQKLT